MQPEPFHDATAELLQSVQQTSWRGWLWIGGLIVVCIWGLFAYVVQLIHGLEVTAMREYVSWGLYISNFVFFIGISHVGALMSAILRLTHAEWRRPITRMAEAITFAALFIGALMPIFDMGRPDRVHYLFLYGRLQSPILWDILCISTYFVGSSLFLYIPLIPDIALCRDRLTNVGRFRKQLYRALALGWQDTPEQRRRLGRSIGVMTAIILPIAVAVHTVVAWIFGMTLRPGWNSTIFGPYFVAGALMSGCASVIVAMAIFRRVYHLERYITMVHFKNLGFLLFVLTLIYVYFNICEYWTLAYKMETVEGRLLSDLFFGDYALLYWMVQIGGTLVPVSLLALSKVRPIRMVVAASAFIVIGAWAKRYLIVVPTMLHPYLPIQEVPMQWAHYFPTWVEWSITFGGLAGFLLIYTIVSKFFPIVSIWETLEGKDHAQPA